MWYWIRRWSTPDSHKTVWKEQPEATEWWNTSYITRLLSPATTYYLVECCYEISIPLISITRFLPFATRLMRFTTHARGLLYFTNYHTYDYGNFRLYSKTLDESKQHTRRVFIGQIAVHIDWDHQQNKLDKGLNEKTESNKKRTCAWRNSTQGQAYSKEYTNTVHLVTIENSIQPPTTTNLRHKAGHPRRRQRTLYSSS
jgi:hypothetical protein